MNILANFMSRAGCLLERNGMEDRNGTKDGPLGTKGVKAEDVLSFVELIPGKLNPEKLVGVGGGVSNPEKKKKNKLIKKFVFQLDLFLKY